MQYTFICVFLSCVFINFIFVFLTSGQDCNSGMQKRMHFRTDMEYNICGPVNNSDVSLGYQFCKNITFILYIIYNVRYNNEYDYLVVAVLTLGHMLNSVHLLFLKHQVWLHCRRRVNVGSYVELCTFGSFKTSGMTTLSSPC